MIQDSVNQFLANAAGLQKNIQAEREEVQKNIQAEREKVQKKAEQAKAEKDKPVDAKPVQKKELGAAIDRVIQQASFDDYLNGGMGKSPVDSNVAAMAMQRVAKQAAVKQQQVKQSFVFNQETFNKMRGKK